MPRKAVKPDMMRVNAAAGFFTASPEPTQETKKEKEPIPKNVPSDVPSVESIPVPDRYKDTVSKYGKKIGRPRKENKSVQFTLTCDASYHDKIANISEKQGKSISAFVRDALDFYIDKNRLS